MRLGSVLKKCTLLSLSALWTSNAWADEPPAAAPATAPAPTSSPQPSDAYSPPEKADGWHLAADIGSDIPIAIGGRVQVEAPFRLRLSTSLGILPAGYVSAINGILIGFKAYPESTGTLIESALKSSLVWRTHVGFRPFRDHGLFGEAGYGLITLGGAASAGEIIEGVTGRQLPQVDLLTSKSFSMASTLHMLDVELGWEWTLLERLHLRAALGGAFTIASSTTISPEYTPRFSRLTKEFTDYGEEYLDNIYTKYVFAPVVSLGVGYVFF